jgi:UDP-glucuronate 4-epimerase
MTAGKPIPVFGDGNSSRDYTFITDILDGIIAATRREFGFQIINLGGSHPIELNRLIELLEVALGKRARIDRKPVQPGDVPATYADVSLAKQLLGYEPRVKIEDGIPLFVEWFLKKRR